MPNLAELLNEQEQLLEEIYANGGLLEEGDEEKLDKLAELIKRKKGGYIALFGEGGLLPAKIEALHKIADEIQAEIKFLEKSRDKRLALLLATMESDVEEIEVNGMTRYLKREISISRKPNIEKLGAADYIYSGKFNLDEVEKYGLDLKELKQTPKGVTELPEESTIKIETPKLKVLKRRPK